MIYFFYGIWNSTEALNSTQRKYSSSTKAKSPIYLGGDESELEGISPWWKTKAVSVYHEILQLPSKDCKFSMIYLIIYQNLNP